MFIRHDDKGEVLGSLVVLVVALSIVSVVRDVVWVVPEGVLVVVSA